MGKKSSAPSGGKLSKPHRFFGFVVSRRMHRKSELFSLEFATCNPGRHASRNNLGTKNYCFFPKKDCFVCGTLLKINIFAPKLCTSFHKLTPAYFPNRLGLFSCNAQQNYSQLSKIVQTASQYSEALFAYIMGTNHPHPTYHGKRLGV